MKQTPKSGSLCSILMQNCSQCQTMQHLDALHTKVQTLWDQAALSSAEAERVARAMVKRGRAIYRASLALLRDEKPGAPATAPSNGTS